MKFAFFLYLFLSLIAFTYEVSAAVCKTRKTNCLSSCNKNKTGLALIKCRYSCNSNYSNCIKTAK